MYGKDIQERMAILMQALESQPNKWVSYWEIAQLLGVDTLCIADRTALGILAFQRKLERRFAAEQINGQSPLEYRYANAEKDR